MTNLKNNNPQSPTPNRRFDHPGSIRPAWKGICLGKANLSDACFCSHSLSRVVLQNETTWTRTYQYYCTVPCYRALNILIKLHSSIPTVWLILKKQALHGLVLLSISPNWPRTEGPTPPTHTSLQRSNKNQPPKKGPRTRLATVASYGSPGSPGPCYRDMFSRAFSLIKSLIHDQCHETILISSAKLTKKLRQNPKKWSQPYLSKNLSLPKKCHRTSLCQEATRGKVKKTYSANSVCLGSHQSGTTTSSNIFEYWLLGKNVYGLYGYISFDSEVIFYKTSAKPNKFWPKTDRASSGNKHVDLGNLPIQKVSFSLYVGVWFFLWGCNMSFSNLKRGNFERIPSLVKQNPNSSHRLAYATSNGLWSWRENILTVVNCLLDPGISHIPPTHHLDAFSLTCYQFHT